MTTQAGMPADTPVWLRQALEDLARAQVRSEERFAAVETQLARLATAQEQLMAQLERLGATQEQTVAQLAQLAAAQQQIADRVGALTGWAWEARVRDRAPSFLGNLAQRVRVLTPSQLDAILDPAVWNKQLSDVPATAARRAGGLAMGRRRPRLPPGHTVRCISCRVQLDPRTVVARLDGGYLCTSCQGMANLLTGVAAREAIHSDRLEG